LYNIGNNKSEKRGAGQEDGVPKQTNNRPSPKCCFVPLRNTSGEWANPLFAIWAPQRKRREKKYNKRLVEKGLKHN
jgi:hypothetical protein